MKYDSWGDLLAVIFIGVTISFLGYFDAFFQIVSAALLES
jgi:hypothetical protein